MKNFKKSWYLQSWFLCFLFTFSIFIIPFIVGIIFLILSIMKDKEIKNNINIEINKHKILYDDKLKDVEGQYAILINNIYDLKTEKESLICDIETLSGDYAAEIVTVGNYDNLRSDEIKNELQLLRLSQKEMIKSGSAVIARGKKSPEILQILMCFNSECANVIESASIKNIDTCRNKLQKSYENVNKIFADQNVKISMEYFKTKLEEISMIYAYMLKMEEEKETQRAIREQMQEEEKVRREIEREKLKIEKEEAQFKSEVKKLMSYMQKSSNDIEKQLYIDKINELENKLKLLEKDKENVLDREQNTRSGHVYIISNIGSFGENVYKIGMTRRLEPMDRIAELSSASVPFAFDVHAMIFSEDAPALETLLHQTFRKYQVNKVNDRKEFFKIDLDDIKKVVLENHNAVAKFVDVPDAVEYRASIKLI